MSVFKLTPEQQAVVDNRGGELLVSAAAGSGKTRVLVERLLGRILNEGRDVTEFLVITFTNAAAAELRARITDEISEKAALDPTDKRLQKQLTHTHLAHIMTIHGFCSMLIKDYASELEMSADFRIMDENESTIMKEVVLDDLLEKRYVNAVNDYCFTEMVDTMSPGRDDRMLREFVLSTYEKVQSHADPERWMSEQVGKQAEIVELGVENTLWGREILDEVRNRCLYWLLKYDEIIKLSESFPLLCDKYLPVLIDDREKLQGFLTALSTGWDEALEVSRISFGRLGQVRSEDLAQQKEYIKSVRESVKRSVKGLRDILTASRSELADDIETTAPALEGLFSLVSDFSKQYTEQKRKLRYLDYNDLEHLALELINGHAGAETAARYTEIMVDEFQDTNEIQDRIIDRISKSRTNVFMVGDVKQSIYRFRLADPTIFLDKYNSFTDCTAVSVGDPGATEGEARKIVLSKNFRSRPEVIEAVNHVFGTIMSPRIGDMEYGDPERLYPGAEYPETGAAQTELALIDMSGSDEEDEESPAKPEVEARYVAFRISRLLREGEVTDGQTKCLRPVRPDDIAILLRSPKGKAEVFAKALKEAGIPCTYGGADANFLTTVEISTTLAVLNIIDNPNQDVQLIAALRSPVFGFTGDELAAIRACDRECSYYDAMKLRAKSDVKCNAFIETLGDLRETASEFSADQLLWRLYTHTKLLAIFAAMDGGRRRRENLLLLYQYARSFESGGHKGLFGFVSHVRRIIEQGGQLRAGAAENSNAVRIMSIHSSKGLEFPIVFISDLARSFNTQDERQRVLIHPELGVGMKVHDRRRKIEYPTVVRTACTLRMRRETLSEEMRIAYVAMTRAREKLIMTAVLNNAESRVAKLSADADIKPHPQALLGMNSLSDWLITAALCRVESGALRQYAVRDIPGVVSDYTWKVNITHKDDVPHVRKKTYTDSAEAETANPEIVREVERRLEYKYPHMEASKIPAKITATYLKGRVIDSEAAEQGDYLAPSAKKQSFNRPNFIKTELTATERGTALHLVMQFIDYSACRNMDSIQAELNRLSQTQIITKTQADCVDPERILRFFKTEKGAEILGGAQILREFKFSLLAPASKYYKQARDDELLLQGVIDCAIIRQDSVVIIDFKTDSVARGRESERAREYIEQMEVYSYALERILKKPVTERMIYFFATDSGIGV